jgi:hypothetical protein
VDQQAAERVERERQVGALVPQREQLAACRALAQEEGQRRGAQAGGGQAAQQRQQQAGRRELRLQGRGAGRRR